MHMETLNEKQLKAFHYIRNCLVHQGRSPTVREVMRELGYSSSNSAAVIIENLIDKGFLKRRKDRRFQIVENIEIEQEGERTAQVPLVGEVPCGAPVLSEENIEARIPVSEKLARPPYNYFLLRARGNSMDLVGIQDGDFVLVRQQSTANNGDYVMALVDGEATIKEFRRDRNVILLKPKSSNKSYKPIIATSDLLIQGVVITAIPNFEE